MSTSLPRMLGLDVGERRIGVAVSEGTLAVPLTIIEHTRRDEDVARIARLARDHAAQRIVVGLPLQADGGEGEQARLTRRFARDLQAAVSVPIEFQDELLSSVDAEAALAAAGGRRRGRLLDDRAAAVILQRYIDAMERQ